MKYFVTVAYHFGAVAGGTPRYEFTFDTEDEVNSYIQSLQDDKTVYIEYLRVIKGEEVGVKKQLTKETKIITKSRYTGI